MERYTQNDLEFFNDLGERICSNNHTCGNCPLSGAEHTCVKLEVYDYLRSKLLITNADIFKKVFGFSAQDGRWHSTQDVEEWLKGEYKGGQK